MSPALVFNPVKRALNYFQYLCLKSSYSWYIRALLNQTYALLKIGLLQFLHVIIRRMRSNRAFKVYVKTFWTWNSISPCWWTLIKIIYIKQRRLTQAFDFWAPAIYARVARVKSWCNERKPDVSRVNERLILTETNLSFNCFLLRNTCIKI